MSVVELEESVTLDELATTTVTKAEGLRESVENALERYFAKLDGEQPSNLYDMVLAEIERPLFEGIMRYTKNNQSLAARVMGLSRGTLRKKLKIYDLL